MQSLNNKDIINIFKGGFRNLEINKVLIDSLNVFPVPDGDTGTNMFLTMVSTIKEMEANQDLSMDEILVSISRGALKGARGNSGVILSQIFKGFTKKLLETKEVTTKSFAKALKCGSDFAYEAVTYPKEGTILTVIRMISEYAVKTASKKTEFISFFESILKKGDEVLASTPDMLPVLKKAGVVDSGGKGLLVILYGMYNALAGIEMVVLTPEELAPSEQQTEFMADIHNLEDIEFAYCTEFFIINLKKNVTLASIDKMRDKFFALGDCVIVIGDLELVKVHIHTNTPDKALGLALQLGELDKLKVENMLEQNRQFISQRQSKKVELKPMGMVAICAGDGMANLFRELGVDVVVEGGQTMNPSVSDIVNAVDKVCAETVFVMPNNKNIILAAEQAQELTKNSLVVIATTNVPQGVSSAMVFDPMLSIDENTRNMQNSASATKCGQITYAVRETEIDGFSLKINDIIGIYDKIVAKGDDVNVVACDTIKTMMEKDNSIITLYYGEGVTEKSAAQLAEQLRADYKDIEVMYLYSGQPHYKYFIAVE